MRTSDRCEPRAPMREYVARRPRVVRGDGHRLRLHARGTRTRAEALPGSDLEVIEVSAETRLDIDGDTVNVKWGTSC
jgi:hypothetical protein